jgi:heme/copper-type cytochrome/quinol oxidase subunit 3
VKIFLASEALFFLVLILAYFYLRAQTPPEVFGGIGKLNPLRTGLFTLALVASSGTVWLAGRSHRKPTEGVPPAVLPPQHRRGIRLWLGTTVALGAVFLIGQATEYAELLRQGYTISSDVFGTQFYTLTGLHFLHVLAGVIMLAILFGFALKGRPAEPGEGAVESVSLYWHFVDVVWIVLLVVLYLVGP